MIDESFEPVEQIDSDEDQAVPAQAVPAQAVPAQAVPVKDGPSLATDDEPERPKKRKRLRRTRKVVGWTALALVILLVLAGLDGVLTVRRSFPKYSGSIKVAGMAAPVTVYRDSQAVPQIYASNADDLFKAQGYVTAQDRFWEMDFRRHVTAGSLSSMFGTSQLTTDEFLRSMGWREVAEQEWNLISPQSKQYLQDYANGVNAYLAGKTTAQVSLEYAVLGLTTTTGYKIAPWTPIDSLAWLKAMAWDLRGNMDDEITRSTLLASGLTRAQVESLYPAYPASENQPIMSGGTVKNAAFSPPGSSAALGDAVHAAPDAATATAIKAEGPALQAVESAIDGLPNLVGQSLPGIGSNSFVVSGALTSTGKPILENDPHLSPSMPAIWYQVGLHCTCGYDADGFSFSGVPGIVIGHNANIAWGFTNLDPDVSDLYLEKVRGNQYEVDGVWKDLSLRKETFDVANSAPVTLTVRSTNNGPLLTDLSTNLPILGTKPAVDSSGKPVSTAGGAAVDPTAGTGYQVALHWTALTPGKTMDALFALNRASNFAQFHAALANFEAPGQNVIYADVDGNIGYQATGQIPIRGKGDGRWPAPGWDTAYDWTGYIPYAALPFEENPTAGYITTSNQEVISAATYPYLLTGDWSGDGYRSQRLADLIGNDVRTGTKITVADAQTMAFDNYSDLASRIVPQLLNEQVTGATAKAQNLLRGWNFQEPADGKAGTTAAKSSAAAAYFETVWMHLLADTFDELPAAQKPNGDDRWWLIMTNLMQDPTNTWWDNKSTPQVETRDDIVKKAMAQASTGLTGVLGSDPTSWRWGNLHTLTLQNQSFGTSGVAPVEWLFNVAPVGVSGGSSIVDATGWDPSTGGFDTNSVPSMRMIVDLSNLDASRWIQFGGESGHAFTSNYSDQLTLWLNGQTVPMRWNQSSIKGAAKNTLTLHP